MKSPRLFLPGLLSTKALLVGIASLVMSGCSPSDEGTPSPAPTTPSPSGNAELRAFFLAEGSDPVPIEGVQIPVDDEIAEQLSTSACAPIVRKVSKVCALTVKLKVHFESGGRMPAALLDWASAQIERAPATPGRFEIAVSDGTEWKCAFEMSAPALAALTLRTRDGAPARLAWDIEAAPRPTALPMGPADLATTADDTTVTLLLPAVQKVREAAARMPPEYPLFPTNGAPPRFEAEVDEETHGELFDGAVEGETELAILALVPRAHGVGGGGGTGKVTLQDFHFFAPIQKEAAGSSRTKLNVVPTAGFELLPSLTEARLDEARALVDALSKSGPQTIALDEAGRILTILNGQPSATGTPEERRAALLGYWRSSGAGGPSEGTQAALRSGLGAFLGKTADVEGLWAYSRVITAARIFDRLHTEGAGADPAQVRQGRALAHAALRLLPDARLPMRPGRLRTGEIDAHDYRAAQAAVVLMGNVSSVLEPGDPSPLAGIEPDEIDVAIESRSQASPAVAEVDRVAYAFLRALDEVLDAEAVTDADLADLDARRAALATSIESLRAATETRLSATTK